MSNYADSSSKAGILKINKQMSLVPYVLNSSPSKRGNWLNGLSMKSNLAFTSAETEIRNAMFEV